MKLASTLIAQVAFAVAFGGEMAAEPASDTTNEFRAMALPVPVPVPVPVPICSDDPDWRDFAHGIPPYIGCQQITREMCQYRNMYGQDVRQNCPMTCGLCFMDCMFDNEVVFHGTYKTSTTGKKCYCNDGTFEQCTIPSNTNRCQGSFNSPTDCASCNRLPECQWQDHKGGFCNHKIDASFHGRPPVACAPPTAGEGESCNFRPHFGPIRQCDAGLTCEPECPFGMFVDCPTVCRGNAGKTTCDFYKDCFTCMKSGCNWDPNWNECRPNNECDFESKPLFPVAMAFSVPNEDTVEMNVVCYSRVDQCFTGDELGGIDENLNGDSCTRATTCNQCVQSENRDPLTGQSSPCVFDIDFNFCKTYRPRIDCLLGDNCAFIPQQCF